MHTLLNRLKEIHGYTSKHMNMQFKHINTHTHTHSRQREHCAPEMASGDRRSLWCCCTARPPGPEHAALWWDGPALPLQGFWTNSTCGQLDGSALASLSQRTQMTPVELRHVEILNTVYCHKLRETFFPPRSLFKTLDSSRKKAIWGHRGCRCWWCLFFLLSPF